MRIDLLFKNYRRILFVGATEHMERDRKGGISSGASMRRDTDKRRQIDRMTAEKKGGDDGVWETIWFFGWKRRLM